MTIYILKAEAREDGFTFSLGAFKSKEKAKKAMEIQEEVTGKNYRHWIEEDLILDD